jgi:hypothetical protein
MTGRSEKASEKQKGLLQEGQQPLFSGLCHFYDNFKKREKI